MSTELLPCPFCGSADVKSLFDGSLAWGYCARCSAEGPLCNDEPAARDAWNRRATPPAVQPSVEVRKMALEEAADKAEDQALGGDSSYDTATRVCAEAIRALANKGAT